MPDLNLISEAELQLEIGQRGINSLEEFRFWLQVNGDQVPNWQETFATRIRRKGVENTFPNPPRMAPSLICKSEVELFGRSIPRFAVRLQIGDGGFVNIRRLATFAGQLYPDKLVPKEVVQWVENAPCIADAFLKPPVRNLEDWHYISGALGHACAECEPSTPDIELVPFVRHMKPGGGMCAQAVSFMASALRRDVEAPVHGMPEITFIATEQQGLPLNKISFDGLTTAEIAKYFNSSRNDRLAARWEASKLLFPPEKTLHDPGVSLVSDFEHALRCYVLSNTPVIAPVDVGRMQGISRDKTIDYYEVDANGKQSVTKLVDPLVEFQERTIFKKNGIQYLQHKPEQLRNLAHVVLVIGCTKNSADLFDNATHPEDSEVLFGFNDPALFPFMTASAHDLVLASSYTSRESPIETILLGWMLPVVPRPVEMPFLDESEGDRAGIFGLSKSLKSASFRCPNGVQVRTIQFENRKPEFRLIQLRRSEIVRHVKDILKKDEDAVTSSYGGLLDRLSDDVNAPWCWLEMDHANLLIWDAQTFVLKSVIPSSVEAFREGADKLGAQLLVGACILTLNDAAIYCAQRSSTPTEMVVKPKLSKILMPTLLTSYDVVRSWLELAKDCQNCRVEYYMFMQKEAESIFVKKPREEWAITKMLKGIFRPKNVVSNRYVSALAWMAEHHADQSLIQKIATSLIQSHPNIVAVATYLPSLCAGEWGPDKKTNPAFLALKFAIAVVGEMRRQGPDRAPKLLELVGGSRMIARIDLDPTSRNYFVRCIEEDLALENILGCLEQLLPEIEGADIHLAFEFEPSCLMALGSVLALESFVSKVRNRAESDPRWRRVGLNLDIAHFAFISRLRPGSLPTQVLESVKHAHVSFHSRGHFADGVLDNDGISSNSKKFRVFEWLMALERLKRNNRFAGFVSLEMECAKTLSQVETSFKHLCEWV